MDLLRKTVYFAEHKEEKGVERTPLILLCIVHRHLINAAHFPISADNREQTFNATTARKPCNYATDWPIKMQENTAFLGVCHSWGWKDRKAEIRQIQRDWRGIELLYRFSGVRIRDQAVLLN